MSAKLEVRFKIGRERGRFLHQPGDLAVGEAGREFAGLGRIKATGDNQAAVFGETVLGTKFDGETH